MARLGLISAKIGVCTINEGTQPSLHTTTYYYLTELPTTNDNELKVLDLFLVIRANKDLDSVPPSYHKLQHDF